jgi:chromosome segregation protein
MRLKQIKLSGFKSFVDPTTVNVPGQRIGVVGPNGCGKSNIIDAVRWVLGESSAKTMRGDAMADVIFNGSTSRKPVGKAAVELVFDNSDGTAPGAWAQYAEISLRRELGRDGESGYFLNKTRCRRRDITDLFLGTGLGARSYAIIEQGMVSRVVEARPDDLRLQIEEAAGISRYKERRRETETRIRHTRENLARVNDLLNEMANQLTKLKRQSTEAARYTTLKQAERQLRAQLLALRWRELERQVGGHDARLRDLAVALERKRAAVHEAEAAIEKLRRDLAGANETLNGVQAEYYRNGAQVAALEQRIEHLREARRQREEELKRLAETRAGVSRHLDQDDARLRALVDEAAASEPRLAGAIRAFDTAAQAFRQTQDDYDAWQLAVGDHARQSAEPERERTMEQARTEELARVSQRLIERQQRLHAELAALRGRLAEEDTRTLAGQVRESEERRAELEQALTGLNDALREKREQFDVLSDEYDRARENRQRLATRLESLREMQAAAFGEHDETFRAWLANTRLADARRLAGELRVEGGWERAVDSVLGERSAALCVERMDADLARAPLGRQASVHVIERGNSASPAAALNGQPRLLDKVDASGVDLSEWLGRVYVAENIEQALARRATLEGAESIVTRDGVWVGRHWLTLPGRGGENGGMILRAQEIETLQQESAQAEREVRETRARLDAVAQARDEFEEEREEKRRAQQALLHDFGEARDRLGRAEARQEHGRAQAEGLARELAEIAAQLTQGEGERSGALTRLQSAAQRVSELSRRRLELEGERERLTQTRAQAAQAAEAARETRQREEMENQRRETEIAALRSGMERLRVQEQVHTQRYAELNAGLGADDEETTPRAELDEALGRRVGAEQALARAREALGTLDQRLRDVDQQRAAAERAAEAVREDTEAEKLARQDLAVRRDGLGEQIREAGFETVALVAELPEQAAETDWQERLAKLQRSLERIGAVNLIAMEEYEKEKERRALLDKQHADLNEALNTLEDVIAKIDRETRERFKETFDRLNAGFQEFFPKLFGGGSAYLELSGEDLLDTGVSVMARPPGKRNSTIHLLSGGEKALTAVSLLFSFFDLNPAPFCMLDEVDAPLDDANVVRYSELLRSLGSRTQLIFITHNKITMESAEQLIGVTMAEPGVSRLVAVDVDQAVAMVA